MIEATPTSLVIPGGCSYHEWEKKGREMANVINVFTQHLRWWLGDWIIAGEQLFPEKYSQALEDSMYSLGTLRNCVYVCRNIPPNNRNPKLSFDHHYEVAKMPIVDQVEWLAKAELGNWTVADLRRAIKGDPNPTRKCLPDRMPDRKEDAEKNAKQSFEEWLHVHAVKLAGLQNETERIRYTWENAR